MSEPRSNVIATSDELTLAEQIRQLGLALGFQDVRFGPANTEQHRDHFESWLTKTYHGDMTWLERNSDKRFRGADLLPGTLTAISVRMDYLPTDTRPEKTLQDSSLAYVSQYALGRDYHKVLRKRLKDYAEKISDLAGQHHYRPFVDSAPIMERQLAVQSGMGWQGKNTLLLAPGTGSWFFLGELFTDLELPHDLPTTAEHCGSCERCLIACPTDAFVSENLLDARKCISYLTIEHKGAIPVELRSLMGNRIYGCDDCQLVCPHNGKSQATSEPDFSARAALSELTLVEAFSWSEPEFLANTEGSAIRRIGYEQWLRNVAVALGNGPATAQAIEALNNRFGKHSALLDDHILWALTRLRGR